MTLNFLDELGVAIEEDESADGEIVNSCRPLRLLREDHKKPSEPCLLVPSAPVLRENRAEVGLKKLKGPVTLEGPDSCSVVASSW